jgi:hypothetical protein
MTKILLLIGLITLLALVAGPVVKNNPRKWSKRP